jgi:hypothetical protein
VSDEKKPKPFAEVVTYEQIDGGRGLEGLRVGPETIGVGDYLTLEDVRDVAEVVNAAVEQREAKLRGAFVALRQSACDAMVAIEHPERTPSAWSVLEKARLDSLPAFADVDAGPRYVPAAEHEALKAELAALRQHIAGAWGGLLEGLAEAEQWTTETLALAKALGLPGADEKLRAEAAAAALMMEAQNYADRAAYTGGEFPRALRSLAGELQARANVYRVQAGLEPTSMDGSPIITAVDLGHEPSEAVTAHVEPDGSLTVTRPQSRAIAFATAEAAQWRVDKVLRRYVEARWALVDIAERDHGLSDHTFRGPMGDRMTVLAPSETLARVELRARLDSIRANGTRPSGFALAGVE